ncbi:MAG: hypothetical protein KIT27_10710 [Legionellales bacterium]|nr:hypothetical protein [Legionellales bacterium]
MSKRSTFDREMSNPNFKKEFNREYKTFLLSEIICAFMQGDEHSVRSLAKEVGLSPTVIQNLRSGKQEDIKLSNFINISRACGYKITLDNGDDTISL